MATQKDLDRCYMATAEAHAGLSRGVRAKVGSVISTPQGVLLGGVNGLAPNGDNTLEYFDEITQRLVSKDNVVHAELNSILKAAKEGVSVLGGTLYVTMSPCLACSEMIAAAGIRRVVFRDKYRDLTGLSNLYSHGIEVEQFKEN